MDMNAAAIFARMVDAKGFSAAARQLAMPMTTVSKKVRDLETSLGVRLLNRTTRRMSLTEAGARVYGHTVEALRHMADAEREARAIIDEPTGPLTIAAPGAIGVPFLLPLVIAFMARHPGVEVTHLSVDTPVDLGDKRIDVMIWPGAVPAGTHSSPVIEVKMGLYASGDYLTRHGRPRVPGDLAHHTAVALIQARSGKRFAWQLDRRGTYVEVEPVAPIRLRSNDPGALLAAVEAGFGIGGLPIRYVERMRSGHDIEAILPAWRNPPITLGALYRDGSAISLKARLFIDFVTEWFRSN